MSNKDIYLYVQLLDKLCSLNLSRLCDKPKFELVYDNSNTEFPIGMVHIVVDSKLYLLGGESNGTIGGDGVHSRYYNNFLRPCKTKEWANTDVFTFDVSSSSLCKDSSFPRMSATKTKPIVATLDNKIYVLARPRLGFIPEIPPEARFEKLDLGERAWKQLSCPPFYTGQIYFTYDGVILCHYAWGSKLVLHMIRGSYIFDAVDDKWEYAESLNLPCLTAAAEYKGLLIGLPLGYQHLVAYYLDSLGLPKLLRNLDELEGIFNPPLQDQFQGFLTLIDGSGRMCLVQSGFSKSTSWAVRVAVFQVFVSTSSTTDNPVVTAVLEAVQLYDMDEFRSFGPVIQSTFLMFQDLSKHDDNGADASSTNSNLSGLASCGDSRKHVAEYILDDAVGKKPKVTFS